MSPRETMDCAAIDELAPAYGLGAVAEEEARAYATHLAQCRNPHTAAMELIDAALLMPMSLEPASPSAALRARIMTTVAVTPQEHAVSVTSIGSGAVRRRWWSTSALPSALAAVALAVAIGVGAWGASLSSQLADQRAQVAQLDATLAAREELLRAVAAADAAFRVTGNAGSGWVLQSGGQAMFMADDLDALPADQHYALWLIHADGTTVRAGAVTDPRGVVLAALDQQLTGAVAFAVTVEDHVAEAPTTDPVLTAQLGA